jgi:ABC-type transport system involved in cytochrome bd biosynthesis fused ATPase/permease subunit
MLTQQFQHPEPPNKANTFMEKAGWPIITIAIGTVLATIIGAVLLGKIQVLNFNWLMLGLGFIMVMVTIFLIWHYLRAVRKLQEEYQANLTALQKENLKFKNELRELYNQKTAHWNNWAVDYTQANMKEQNERLEGMEKRLIEKITDAKNGMDGSIKNAQTLFSGAVNSYERAVDLYREQLLQTVKQIKTLEERLEKESLPESNTKID